MIEKVDGAWIFVSHSSRDWEKVREIRNFLEDKGHNPLLFYLKCLEADDEIDDLLKREIQARNWFVLCDSKNARASKYVSNEIEYIKSLEDKVFEIIDLEKEVNSQLDKLVRLSKRATIYLACSRFDKEIAEIITKTLRDNDYQVFNQIENLSKGKYSIENRDNQYIEIENSIKNGFFLPIITKNSMRDEWALHEIRIAFELRSKHSQGKNIAPIYFVSRLELSEGLPEGLSKSVGEIMGFDFITGSILENLDKLVRELKTWDMG